jgi:hypothetical protein
MPVGFSMPASVATIFGWSGVSMSTISSPASAPISSQRPATAMALAPRRRPSGLNVSARVRKLLLGLPSVSVVTSTSTSPSSRSAM